MNHLSEASFEPEQERKDSTSNPPTKQNKITWDDMYKLMTEMKSSLDYMSDQYDSVKDDTRKITVLINEIIN